MTASTIPAARPSPPVGVGIGKHCPPATVGGQVSPVDGELAAPFFIRPCGIYVARRSRFEFMTALHPKKIVAALFHELPLAEHGWSRDAIEIENPYDCRYVARRK